MCKQAKIAISMQSSTLGMPICMSEYAILSVGFKTPTLAEERRLMTMVCQKEKKMTSLMLTTLRNGLCSAMFVLSWM